MDNIISSLVFFTRKTRESIDRENRVPRGKRMRTKGLRSKQEGEGKDRVCV